MRLVQVAIPALISVVVSTIDAGASAQTSQQQLMTTCNATASQRSLKGDARKGYMSACLSGKANQTTLMKVCNAQATQDKLSADARRAYVNGCLKKS